jgi:hypothetical protein
MKVIVFQLKKMDTRVLSMHLTQADQFLETLF